MFKKLTKNDSGIYITSNGNVDATATEIVRLKEKQLGMEGCLRAFSKKTTQETTLYLVEVVDTPDGENDIRKGMIILADKRELHKTTVAKQDNKKEFQKMENLAKVKAINDAKALMQNMGWIPAQDKLFHKCPSCGKGGRVIRGYKPEFPLGRIEICWGRFLSGKEKCDYLQKKEGE